MEIVIEISDTLMEYIIQGRDLSEEQNDEMACAIVDGTPLPKGHGRLIDADRLTRAEIMPFWYHLPNGDIACPKIDIDHAPTIIEADKCTYKEIGCGSCKRQLDCPTEAEGSDSE
jgi:hypothetical protein